MGNKQPMPFTTTSKIISPEPRCLRWIYNKLDSPYSLVFYRIWTLWQMADVEERIADAGKVDEVLVLETEARLY